MSKNGFNKGLPTHRGFEAGYGCAEVLLENATPTAVPPVPPAPVFPTAVILWPGARCFAFVLVCFVAF